MARQKASSGANEAAPAAPPAGTEYTVLARRYRPQTFSDVVGQEPVAQALVNALRTHRVAHAYLFTGARGVGKTSTARILAKALNCEKGPTPTPCGECAICQSIAGGDDVDVLEIDGASNRGIDEVREIRNNVQYRPSRSRYKIYIIDEVHMLTAPAFNALLKTLEEPPPHVKFIFATTEVQRIPITILSRCQRFDFSGIALPRITERLRSIVTREGMQADDEALELVARRAGGSMRDAQSLLDQLLAFSGERLTAEQVHQLLGTAGDDRIAVLATAILAKDHAKTLDLLDEGIRDGLQLGELLDQLIAYWRDLMVAHCAGTEGRDLSVPGRHRDALIRQAKALNLDAILAGLDVLSTTRAQLRASSHGRTLVEMALVRLGRLENLASLVQMAQWLSQYRSGATAPASPAAAASARVAPPEGVKKNAPEVTVAREAPAGPIPLTADNLDQIWAKTLRMVGTLLAHSLERACKPAIFAPNTLVIQFEAAYNGAKEHCQEPSCVSKVEAALKVLTGQAWALRFEMLAGEPGSTESPTSGNETETRSTSRSRRNYREEAEKLPLIQRAVQVLGASIQRVDEGFGAEPMVRPESAEATGSEER
jgi:DNA polymerase-3 subunit gamma/tau